MSDSVETALVYGIDIGDWNCAVAVGHQAGSFELLAALVIPAAVGVGADGTYLAGTAANRELRHEPARYRRGLLRAFAQDERIWLGETFADAEHLMSVLLSELGAAARAAVPGIPARVAIAVPAGWSEGRREAMRQAAAGAGFDRQRIIFVDQPVAAATTTASRMTGSTQRHLLIYDLGGTSFACTLVRRTTAGRLVTVGQTTTRTDLGAAVFEQEILCAMAGCSPRVAELLVADAPDLDQRHRVTALQALAEHIKVLLSTQQHVSVYVTTVEPGFAIDFDQDAFSEAVRLRITATVTACEGLLSRHDLTWADIDVVVLVGGGANLPAVDRAVSKAARHGIDKPGEPATAVARGAAGRAAAEIRTVALHRRLALEQDAKRSVPVTGAPKRDPVQPAMFSGGLVAWLVWAATGGWFTAVQWHGPGMRAVLAAGTVVLLLLVVGYVLREHFVVGATVAAVALLVVLHMVTLVVVAYRAIFTDVHAGWIPYAATIVPAIAAFLVGAAAYKLYEPIEDAATAKRWLAGRRAMLRTVQRDKQIGEATPPAFVTRLIGEYVAAKAFTPASDPFDFAIVMGRTLLLGATGDDPRPTPDQLKEAVSAYLGSPASMPTPQPYLSLRGGPSHLATRFANRPINVHCFVQGELDAAAEQYLIEARKALPNFPEAQAATGWPVVSTSLSIVNGGDMEDRMRRLLDRADRELYLPLLERAAEAAGITA